MSDQTTSMNEATRLAIAAELERLHVSELLLGSTDGLDVNDELDGWSSLGSSAERHDLYWYGLAEELLHRLRELPERCGRNAVCDAFRSRYPG
jgi:hypothetical protein